MMMPQRLDAQVVDRLDPFHCRAKTDFRDFPTGATKRALIYADKLN
jgi:hypothetical protein